jgi:hypothetical protein
MHYQIFLTSSFGFETPDESAVHAALQFYHTFARKQWLTSKGLSLEALSGFYHTELNSFGIVRNLSRKLQAVRVFQFFDMLPSLGLLLIALAALLHALGRGRSRFRGGRRRRIVKTTGGRLVRVTSV